MKLVQPTVYVRDDLTRRGASRPFANTPPPVVLQDVLVGHINGELFAQLDAETSMVWVQI